jgi:hypothetical protein
MKSSRISKVGVGAWDTGLKQKFDYILLLPVWDRRAQKFIWRSS